MTRHVDKDRLAAARAWSQWHLGSTSWADSIFEAYDNPERTWEILAAAGMELAKDHVGPVKPCGCPVSYLRAGEHAFGCREWHPRAGA